MTPWPHVLAAHGEVDVAAVLGRQRDRESSARTYARAFPVVPVHAEGLRVTGADGRQYLDCLAGAGTLALGHNHPVVLAAIRRVLDSGAPLHALDISTPEKDDFTTALLDTLPPELARDCRVHFCGPAGTDAVEAALKLTRTATGRQNVFAFTGAYHGMTAGALAASAGLAVREPLADNGFNVTRLPFPYDYRCPFALGGTLAWQVGVNLVESLLTDDHSGVLPPAAMILEAVQGEGGVVPAPDPWLRELRRVTAEHGIPLIVDEVQTGVGRTGAYWAVQHSGVTPDVMVLSKAIGGSLPLAAIVYRADLDQWAPGAHTGTFRGNQLAMAAGAATLRHVTAEDLPARAAELGTRLLRELRSLQARTRCIGEVRGRGLMLGLEIVDPDTAPDRRGTRPAAPALAAAVREQCLRRGLILELGGRQDSVVRLLPPLVITDAEADTVLNRLAEAVAAAEQGARR
ncbi:diaminobutyrate-2-oxoglutarate transaminase [Crossiella equi]|uniref:Diaminobutyrate--2-oxoglutarate transaminase n=2 Tax=Crossiella equi TaxID=130796 RepID=A0ABS5ANL2_9PSEU|nr:diaminobutyrate--2-oxoglutarate transaminase family protein [Crossiella equi]MBP2477827.1 diaminobutyrate-2-oxoglutarate transaminase [Crossiella equi]